MFRHWIANGRIVLGASLICAPLLLSSCGKKTEQAQTTAGGEYVIDRTVLPIAEPPIVSITEIDARKATPPKRFEVKAPDHAPNVVIVLIDDMGFGCSSAFGGPIYMPTLEKLASSGLRYNRFHTHGTPDGTQPPYQ